MYLYMLYFYFRLYPYWNIYYNPENFATLAEIYYFLLIAPPLLFVAGGHVDIEHLGRVSLLWDVSEAECYAIVHFSEYVLALKQLIFAYVCAFRWVQIYSVFLLSLSEVFKMLNRYQKYEANPQENLSKLHLQHNTQEVIHHV